VFAARIAFAVSGLIFPMATSVWISSSVGIVSSYFLPMIPPKT
jgi:hypothetical protein